jgi:pimeloyl-ACP methyl ester carboxylesterase
MSTNVAPGSGLSSGEPVLASVLPAETGTVQMINHARLRIALHCLRSGEGQALLLLHGLGERTVNSVPAWASNWTGPIYGLDFTGHGLSDRPRGGGYNCELLMADVDTALAITGAATIVGRGLGGYVGLLIAGARPKVVRGLVIADGVGLAGGGVRPGAQTIGAPNLPPTPDSSKFVLSPDSSKFVPSPDSAAPDPFVFLELTSDVRPTDYALNFLRSCVSGSDLALPVSVASAFRPPWLQAVCEHPSVNVIGIPEALAAYAES